MGQYIKETGILDRPMEKGNLYMLIRISMMDHGQIIRLMGMEFLNIKMDLLIKDIG